MSTLTINGLQYEIDVEGSGPPLVLLHGFTGSRESWGTIEPWLSMAHTVIAIDLLGHGGTSAPTEPDRYGVDHQIADLAQIWVALSLEQAAVVGYSMGARLALAFAVRYPALVDQLILISGGAGICDSHVRAMRSRSDELLA
ncbi:MAG: alpha/beta fold hydrolase, partial [Chloroflexota bacterium]